MSESSVLEKIESLKRKQSKEMILICLLFLASLSNYSVSCAEVDYPLYEIESGLNHMEVETEKDYHIGINDQGVI